jgi:hypothetical protein
MVKHTYWVGVVLSRNGLWKTYVLRDILSGNGQWNMSTERCVVGKGMVKHRYWETCCREIDGEAYVLRDDVAQRISHSILMILYVAAKLPFCLCTFIAWYKLPWLCKQFLTIDVRDKFDLWQLRIIGFSKPYSDDRTLWMDDQVKVRSSTFVGKHKMTHNALSFHIP